jgi:hypothetical protein
MARGRPVSRTEREKWEDYFADLPATERTAAMQTLQALDRQRKRLEETEESDQPPQPKQATLVPMTGAEAERIDVAEGGE